MPTVINIGFTPSLLLITGAGGGIFAYPNPEGTAILPEMVTTFEITWTEQGVSFEHANGARYPYLQYNEEGAVYYYIAFR